MTGNNRTDDQLKRQLAALPDPPPATLAFKRRLLAIPEHHSQAASGLSRLRARLPEMAGWLSAPALAAQAAVLVLVAIAGLWSGLATSVQEVDMSDWARTMPLERYEEDLL